MSDLANNGAVATPPAPGTAGQPIDLRPRVAAGDKAALSEVLTSAFLEQPAGQPKPGSPSGTPDPNAPRPGTEGAPPANEHPEGLDRVKSGEPDHAAINAKPEPKWTTDQQAYFELRAKAKPEDLQAIDAQAPGFTPEQIAWLDAQEAEAGALNTRAQEAGRTPEEQRAFEQAEAAKNTPKSYTQAEVEELITGRVHKLADENADLKRQLAEAGQPRLPETAADPFANVFDAAALDRAAGQAREGLNYSTRLLNRLSRNPAGVEQELRALAAKNPEVAERFKNAAGEDDYSPEHMGDVLEGIQQSFAAKVEAAPKRAEWLKVNSRVEAGVAKVFPWIGKAEDPRYSLMQQMERQLPQIKLLPDWKHWLACGIERHLQIVEEARKNGAASGARKAPPVMPRTARPGGNPPAGRNGEAAAKAALKSKPTAENLTAYFEARGFPRG